MATPDQKQHCYIDPDSLVSVDYFAHHKIINPNCPHEKQKQGLSQWMRDNGPVSKTTKTTFFDIDGFLQNHEAKKMMLLEQKTNGNTCDDSQTSSFWDLENLIRDGIEKTEKGYYKSWVFLGFYTITFKGYSFKDGYSWIEWRGQTRIPITEEKFKKFIFMILDHSSTEEVVKEFLRSHYEKGTV